jgi:hypothetical protein
MGWAKGVVIGAFAAGSLVHADPPPSSTRAAPRFSGSLNESTSPSMDVDFDLSRTLGNTATKSLTPTTPPWTPGTPWVPPPNPLAYVVSHPRKPGPARKYWWLALPAAGLVTIGLFVTGGFVLANHNWNLGGASFFPSW